MDEMQEIEKEETFEQVEKEREPGELVVGLDIGTTKICCVVGEVTDESTDIIGVGIVPSQGLKKGIVVNIESTVNSIKQAVRAAEEAAGCDLRAVDVYVGIAGNHIKGFNSPGILAINNREIKKVDIDEVISAARTVKISENQQVIHVMPQEYMVDDHTGIQNPIGMTGVRLVTNVHMVTADIGAVHNLVTCCNKAGLEVADIVLESIAAANAVLSRDEMELGVALVDIGGGTTDVAVFCDGTIRHTCEIGLGGHNLTNDLSVGLRTPLQEAERLKEDFGGAIASIIKPNLVVDVPTVGDREPRKVTQKVLVDILEARMIEILEMVDRELVASGQKNRINGGVVITGGTALLANVVDLAEQIFDMQVRIGYPSRISGRVEEVYSPRCTTAVGLVMYGREKGRENRHNDLSVIGRMKGWFKKIM
ncbi:cell division protein FtsA [Desulfoprunum benzoelyticum]|uniref:Cell division protein FtsA n=2 Tax=Desulfoprunum benzoelyticum TaxID=1506996 RepID=A0A840US06_9BACT|nr:cell division protein FtsA [Desulfoprunum benzoelyticum]MBB5347606.1 cell division protein FtsA [Desulfoprunum benzoelyticum]MBM9529265.1 cell division protein FtsA [Desulfoprunum benzoelyticum]